MQKRRMPRNVKRASGAVVCAGLLLSGCSGHPLADTAREALQAVTAGEALPAPLARAYLLLSLSLALNVVMVLCWAGGQLARLGRLVRRMTARQKKEIVVKVEQMAPNRSTVQCDSPMPETPFIIPEPEQKTEIRAKKPERRSSRQEKGQAVKQPVPFPVSWTVKMKKKQKETQDILSYHTQAAGCSDKARAKASGGRQPIEECGRTGL